MRKGPVFGPRKDEFLPYLLVRANAGDRGQRPFAGAFWESPDIYVSSNQLAEQAPLMPPGSAGVAQAGAPNTLYAHIWNLGKAPAYRVRVEFYWFDPSLGITRTDANLIGAATLDLANRFTLYPGWQEVTSSTGSYVTRGCHAVVRCPETWYPRFENGGHECLVVRAFEPMLDPLSFDQFSPATDRHVGQRNIAVVQAHSPAGVDLSLDLGYHPRPGQAEISLESPAANDVEWLKLYLGDRNATIDQANGVVSGLHPPTVAGSHLRDVCNLQIDSRAAMLRQQERFQRGCDRLAVGVHASIADMASDEAYVLRVRQTIDGELTGGYSVVLIGT